MVDFADTVELRVVANQFIYKSLPAIPDEK
jgi:hypothetical protein